jgi:hypothetical protein
MYVKFAVPSTDPHLIPNTFDVRAVWNTRGLVWPLIFTADLDRGSLIRVFEKEVLRMRTWRTSNMQNFNFIFEGEGLL